MTKLRGTKRDKNMTKKSWYKYNNRLFMGNWLKWFKEKTRTKRKYPIEKEESENWEEVIGQSLSS